VTAFIQRCRSIGLGVVLDPEGRVDYTSLLTLKT
jgi:hypothetical protein